jgi:hypothetical protein
MRLTREAYKGHLIQVGSFDGALRHPTRNRKWGEWYPAYRIYVEGSPGKIVHQETLDNPYQSQDEADRSAFTAAKSWIDSQTKPQAKTKKRKR